MRFASRLAISSALMLGTTPVFAADLDATSRIDAVSVYPDGATVTRTIDFDAPAGESTLLASDLPTGLDPASLRVDTSEAAGIAIAGIDSTIATTNTPQPDASLAKALVDLQDKRNGVAASLSALQTKQSLIERYASTSSLGPGKDGPDAAALRASWNAVGDDLAQVNEAIRQHNVELRGLDEQITTLQAKNNGRPAGQQHTQLHIAFSTDQPAKGKLHISYLIGNAGWTPLYDARLDATKGSLEIVRRARIAQSTGEDWQDVALTISTAHASTGAAVPKLASSIINFLPEVAYDAAAPSATASKQSLNRAEAPPPPMVAAAPAPLEKPAPGHEIEAKTDLGGFQSVWVLPSRTTILSGPATKSLRLASFTQSPEIVARAAPALQQAAYLEAKFDHSDDTPLYPGRVSVYRDGLYVGQAEMPLATKGEPVRLGFGVDDRIKVDRVVTRKLDADSGVFHPTSSERRDYKISLRNGRPTPIKVSVEEAMPVSENKDITVEPSPKMTPPTTKDADNRRGIQVWTFDLAPGATKDIGFGYKVTWPADQTVNLD
jgi:uncharacterized protein (TIGR02231 family)